MIAKLSKLDVFIPESEVCSQISSLLDRSLPSYIVLTSVDLNEGRINLKVRYERILKSDFAISFSMSCNGADHCVRLHVEKVSCGTFLFGAIMKVVVDILSIAEGVSYSWTDNCFCVDVAELLENFGVKLNGCISDISFDDGLRINIS